MFETSESLDHIIVCVVLVLASSIIRYLNTSS